MIKSIFETLFFYHDKKKALSVSLHWIFLLVLCEINRKHFHLRLTFRCKTTRYFPMMTMFTFYQYAHLWLLSYNICDELLMNWL